MMFAAKSSQMDNSSHNTRSYTKIFQNIFLTQKLSAFSLCVVANANDSCQKHMPVIEGLVGDWLQHNVT